MNLWGRESRAASALFTRPAGSVETELYSKPHRERYFLIGHACKDEQTV